MMTSDCGLLFWATLYVHSVSLCYISLYYAA